MYKLLIINLVAIQFMCGAQPILLKEVLMDGQYILTPQKVQLGNQLGKYLVFWDLEKLPSLETLGDVMKIKTIQ